MTDQLKITQNVFDLLVKSKRERNRYRSALEIIATSTYPASYSGTLPDGTKVYGRLDDAANFARRVLDGEDIS